MHTPTPIALFPRDLDTLFLDAAKTNIVPYYLVEVSTPEEQWARSFLPAEYVLSYRLSKKINHAQKTLDNIFEFSDLADVLHAKNIKHLLLVKISSLIDAWSKEHQISLISVPYSIRKTMEDKIYFDQWLSEHHIAKPQSKILTLSELQTEPILQKIVIQTRESSGAEGTYFAETDSEKDQVLTLLRKQDCTDDTQLLVRQYIEGTPYGISVLITDTTIAISDIRIQCYDKQALNNQDIYSGISWLTAATAEQKQNINSIFSKLGTELYQANYRGLLNFDFMLSTAQHVYLIECNARYSAATAHTVMHPELLGGLNTNTEIIDSVLSGAGDSESTRPEIWSQQDGAFHGTAMVYNFYPSKEKPELRISASLPSGLYTLTDSNEVVYISPDIRLYKEYADQRVFVFFSDVAAGEVYSEYSTLAFYNTNFALYDLSGNLNELGALLREFFIQKVTS